MEVIIPFFIAHWYSSLFFQTFFLHRYASHAAFTMSKFTEKVFFVLTWIFQGSNYLSPYGYGVMHRMHHAFADTPEDPHSPTYDESIFKMMWKTKTIYSAIASKKMIPEERFTKNVPQWTPFDKFVEWRRQHQDAIVGSKRQIASLSAQDRTMGSVAHVA